MSPSVCLDSGQLLLRWSEGSDSRSREELVDILSGQRFEIVVRSSCEVVENTHVVLTAKRYTANGIARSCRKDAGSFILAILTDKDSDTQSGSRRDPGIFAVEDFLTEEQEAEILENLDESEPGTAGFAG